MKNQELTLLQNEIYRLISQDTKVEYVHGILTAILCAPDMIMPSSWIPFIFEGEPEFESIEDANYITGLLMTFYNDIAKGLQDKTFEPLLKISGKASRPEEAQPWCQGFIRGLVLWDREVTREPEVINTLTSIIMLSDSKTFFSTRPELEKLDPEVKKEMLESAFDNIAGDVLMLHRHQVTPAFPNPSDLPSAKVGRNDPCPCGSGKKYKKCCGR